MNTDLIKTEGELAEIADFLSEELAAVKSENAVSRFSRNITDSLSFANGKRIGGLNVQTNINKEMMDRGIYTTTCTDDFSPNNFSEVAVARDLQNQRFIFHQKGVPLPVENYTFIDDIPSNIDIFDEEIQQFTKEHKNSVMKRILSVEQRIVVNSKGGIAVQSIPFFGISYSYGYSPIPTYRDITVVCTNDDEIKRLPSLIKYLADPTPDRRIKRSNTFDGAFHELYKISGLRFGSLEEAGIPLRELYDVVMLNGVPIHEIFGHHFEEPIRHLNFGESGTFKNGQIIKNKDLIITDNPKQKLNGFRVLGFTNFDAYGRLRIARENIKDGIISEFLGSEYADPINLKRFLNIEKCFYVGSASQPIDGMFPQPRMSCTVLDGKTENVDLEGKILIVPLGGHTRSEDKTYMVNGHECYVVRDGEPKRVIPLKVTGGINQALANISLLNETSYQVGTCGKPEPICSMGTADAAVSQVAKSQPWRGQQVYPLPISEAHLKILQNIR